MEINRRKVHQVGQSSLASFIDSTLEFDVGSALFFGDLKLENLEDFFPLLENLKIRAIKEGKRKLVGPLNESTFFDYRLKMNFFDESKYIGEPQNSERLLHVFEKAGFRNIKMYFSHEFKIAQRLLILWLGGPGLLARIWMYLKGYRVERLTESKLLANYKALHQIIHEIFSSNFLYAPISDDQFLDLVKSRYADNIQELGSCLLISPAGDCVGFNLCLKDSAKPDRILFKAHGVKKAHRFRGAASMALMSKSFYALVGKYRYCLACLTIQGSRVDGHFHSMSQKHYEYGLFELIL